ncbi:alpha/beta hydrolase family protein [Smaragdicoccus niigatensis]|uniref:alpha/beta hydrolase family protein n=1 Tax=Smaragdicoccus niigatensis TaxID=359359 RepID=UPI0003756580|nr:alpha/beta hydrolase [Smaragdicoccus niigatensis]
MRGSTIRYGPARSQFAELFLPEATDGSGPVVVLVHGGFWRNPYGLEQMYQLIPDLVERGYAVLNVEYRRIGEPGGGWPGTLEDASAAVDSLAEVSARVGYDFTSVVALGHSAGGQLALWLAARRDLPQGAPGSSPIVPIDAAIALAGVVDLRLADQLRLGAMGDQGAAAWLLGGNATQVPDRYNLASPCDRVPLGVPQLLIHGHEDTLVPIDVSRAYAAAARAAGDAVELVELAGAGHFDVVDTTHDAWAVVVERLSIWVGQMGRHVPQESPPS